MHTIQMFAGVLTSTAWDKDNIGLKRLEIGAELLTAFRRLDLDQGLTMLTCTGMRRRIAGGIGDARSNGLQGLRTRIGGRYTLQAGRGGRGRLLQQDQAIGIGALIVVIGNAKAVALGIMQIALGARQADIGGEPGGR
jgi:hypothetical protein